MLRSRILLWTAVTILAMGGMASATALPDLPLKLGTPSLPNLDATSGSTVQLGTSVARAGFPEGDLVVDGVLQAQPGEDLKIVATHVTVTGQILGSQGAAGFPGTPNGFHGGTCSSKLRKSTSCRAP
jgi:hypothetical protein